MLPPLRPSWRSYHASFSRATCPKRRIAVRRRGVWSCLCAFRIGAGGRSENPTLVRNPLPRPTLDRPPTDAVAGFPCDFKQLVILTGTTCEPGRIGSLTLLPNDWAPVYFSGTGDTLGCWAGVAAARSASGRNGLRRRPGLARRLRFSRRKRLCAFAARQQKDIAMRAKDSTQ